MKSDLIDVTLQLHHETDKAILVSDDGETKVWLAKSLVEFTVKKMNKAEKIIEATMPEWLALDKKLI